ncbi:T-lymphocyte activation antigen CD80 isoform 2-T4 [Trichechus inunguis]
MRHTLMRGTPPLQWPHFKLFQLLVLTGLFHFCLGDSQVTKAVKEMAVLSCDYNIPTQQLMNFRIYWQKNNEVVLTIISGNISVWPKYKNRTIVDIANNLSIVILALRLSDKGTYTCIVQKTDNGVYRREHLALVKLSIRDFHDPIITDLGNPSADIKKILCSTSGGFPEPRLSWLENGEQLNVINLTVSQDPETELYNISSELHFNLTRNHTFVCLIKYGDQQVSQTFPWIISKPSPLVDPFPLWVTILITIIGICGMTVLITCCWNHSKYYCTIITTSISGSANSISTVQPLSEVLAYSVLLFETKSMETLVSPFTSLSRLCSFTKQTFLSYLLCAWPSTSH